RFYIKQYEEETNFRCHILLDTSASMAYGSRGVTKFEYGCLIAASVAYLISKQQDSVGLALFRDALTRQVAADIETGRRLAASWPLEARNG
ncbi:MAG: DUF58 domain-containing protein, partial [Candidatus Rokubacteria bacterium]|nr:DUF58 domain-containing protein [Candidatus Rokubacteria bacterium]